MRTATPARPALRLYPCLAMLCTLALALPRLNAMAQDATTFTVTVEDKTTEHPFYQQGWHEGFVIDGTQGKVLTLQRGVTYTFQLQGVSTMHSFYITTSDIGNGQGTYSEGVTNNFASGNETVTFTPGADTPDELYYQCGNHGQMGSEIHVEPQAQAGDADLELVVDGLTSPVTLVEPPDDTGRLFVVDQVGKIWIVTADGTMLDEPFLDLSDKIVDLNPGYDERGLLGLAFHPDYATNGRFFVYYAAPPRPEAPENFNNTTHLAEFAVSADDPNKADPASEDTLLLVDEPQANHEAGTVAFGPDGYLYLSLGDGGGANDINLGHVDDWYDGNAGGNGQDVDANLLGSILRIDVDNPAEGKNYGIPADNPALAESGPDEQYAYGFRNPYRFSFDMGGDHALIVGDAGQNLYEEVSVVTKGGNYGWNVKEGTHCFDAENPFTVPDSCPSVDDDGDPLIDPVIEFENSSGFPETGLGLVVIGGNVYRGTDIPALQGKYIFGAWSRGETEGATEEEEVHLPGRIFMADMTTEGMWPFSEMTIANVDSFSHFILGFGQDLSGEMYVLTTDSVGPAGSSGKVFRLSPVGTADAVESGQELPSHLKLAQNYPNPFRPAAGPTTINFDLQQADEVTLSIYDVAGREIRQLVQGRLNAGTHTVAWDGTDAGGRPAPSGTYFYRLSSTAGSQTRSLVLLK
ncbi:MAG TPA: PQQ-dependent sugar dehydrogenase [Rhodothermales bacterium]|nr:PQQ-dependent sugar dehydrogenase [Rhodothermales bacterium]